MVTLAELGVPPNILEHLPELSDAVEGLLVYGSRARGDAVAGSDLDLLALVTSSRPGINSDAVSVSFYTEEQPGPTKAGPRPYPGVRGLSTTGREAAEMITVVDQSAGPRALHGSHGEGGQRVSISRSGAIRRNRSGSAESTGQLRVLARWTTRAACGS